MKLLRFEYSITILYLLIGGLWIIFSDKILYLLINESSRLSEFQTYKGWFYVIITAIGLFFFIKKHLNKRRNLEKELKEFQNQLEKMVKLRTEELETAIKHLRETQAQLLHSEKMASLGILTAGVAHEINNPLNYIMGSYVGLLRHYRENTFSDNPEQVGKLIDAMKIGIDRSSAIVHGLNQFSRKSDSYTEKCNVHEILENSLTMLNNLIKQHITVKKDFSASEIVIQGNVGHLHQVFINIIVNAVQSIESEGEITIKTEDNESDVLIAIADTGLGIPKENLKNITDPFFTTKAPGEGTGLGLSITYNIIKEHKGKLIFESQEGKGTTVKVIIPKPIYHEQESKDYLC
ncbi:GHKL domain-containing protein [Dysgonomonadaceae bacterium zrk40]|nr:GHKL domain-containing protein [Dysgonomonadaceae bacterium zrk40]